MELRKATKQKAKLRIGLGGTSGSGKTYSALLLANGITSWDKIGVIDTENGSADLYDNLGGYNVCPLEAPYTPERYIEAIKECEKSGMEVIIIDSITHEWDGKGGCLEIIDDLTKADSRHNSYTQWSKVTPRHNAFVQTILQSKCHIITTVRKKQDYSMELGSNGKAHVQKQGLKEITREGFEYELTLSFDLTINHLATASKDRTGLFMDKPEFVITQETGNVLKTWAEKGVDPLPVKPQPPTPNTTPPKLDSTKERAIAWLKKIPQRIKSVQAIDDLHQYDQEVKKLMEEMQKAKNGLKNYPKLLEELSAYIDELAGVHDMGPTEPADFSEFDEVEHKVEAAGLDVKK